MFLAIAAATCSAQSVNRCVDANGKVTFSDTECTGTRSAVKLRDNAIGDGGHAKAMVAQIKGETSNAIDLALRRYRDAAYTTKKLRAALDNNSASRDAETAAILAEIKRCQFHRIPTPRCQEVEAMQQSEIDRKWHTIWRQDHAAWTASLEEQSKASRAYVQLTGKLPPE